MAILKKKRRLPVKSSANKKSRSEFKPGSKPYVEFNGQILNGNVPWHNMTQEILNNGYTPDALSKEVGLSQRAISKILQRQYDELYFRAGAILLQIHCRFYPERYP